MKLIKLIREMRDADYLAGFYRGQTDWNKNSYYQEKYDEYTAKAKESNIQLLKEIRRK